MTLSVQQKLINCCCHPYSKCATAWLPKKHSNTIYAFVHNHRFSYFSVSWLVCAVLLGLSLLYSSNASALTLSNKAILWMQQNYGPAGVSQLQRWAELINTNKDQPELFKLNLVTAFFNKIPFKTDLEVWKQENYWATPLEFLGKNAGDCEDFAIAKYISLKAMGIPAQKLRIVYVVSSQLAQPHMVLAYYETPDANPLILDNLTPKILYASDRPDLKPVYMFSDDALWVTSNQGAPKQIGNGAKIKAWVDLLVRMRDEGLTEDELKP